MDKNNFFTKKATVFSLTLICCLLWGSAFPCIKIGCKLLGVPTGESSSQILFAGERFILAGLLVILTGSFIQKKPLIPHKKDIPKICLLSLFQTILQYTFFYIGLSHTTGMKSSIITASNVFMSILVSALVFRTEKLDMKKLLGCMVGFAGVVIINLGSGSDLSFRFIGEGMVFLSALSYAFSASLNKKFSVSSEPLLLSGWQFFLGGTAMTIAGAVSGGSSGNFSVSGALMLLYLAFISAAAFSLWSLLLKYNPVSSVSVFGFMNPVFGVILSALLLSEKSSADALQVISALVLVAAGIITVNFSSKKGGSNG